MTDATTHLPTLPDDLVRELVAVVGDDSLHIERTKVDEFQGRLLDPR
ncbi:hypothetical protein [Streptomyces sp. T028]